MKHWFFGILVAWFMAEYTLAAPLEYIYTEEAPPEMLQHFPFLHGLKPEKPEAFNTRVDLPGFPVVEKPRVYMKYVPYVETEGAKFPDFFRKSGLASVFYRNANCNIAYVHEAMPKGVATEQLIAELFRLTFRSFLHERHVSPCEASLAGVSITFDYEGRVWTFEQLEVAASYIGILRAAERLKKPALKEEATSVAKLNMHPHFGLLRYLLWNQNSSNEKFEAAFQRAAENLINKYKDTPLPKRPVPRTPSVTAALKPQGGFLLTENQEMVL